MLELKESLPSVFGAHDKDLNFAPDYRETVVKHFFFLTFF